MMVSGMHEVAGQSLTGNLKDDGWCKREGVGKGELGSPPGLSLSLPSLLSELPQLFLSSLS